MQQFIRVFCSLCMLSFAVSLAVEVRAQSFCFLSASTYYEQIYCELQAKGEARGLPPFNQFKRNEETIQAVLLKRPAARIGIEVPQPKKRSQPPAIADRPLAQTPPASSARRPNTSGELQPPGQVSVDQSGMMSLNGCALQESRIECAERRYQLTGNRLNHRLNPQALTDENTMALPGFSDSMQDSPAVNRYLTQAYRRYIEKMHEIGLGGATMTYSKFSFLFFDLHEKGLNFSQRFEIMYGFLKKDKANMGVSEKLTPDQQLSLADCDPLSEQLLVCSRAGRNYLFVALSE